MTSHTADHQHAADLEATLDFMNTAAPPDGSRGDDLASAEDAIGFLRGRGIAHEEPLREQRAAVGGAAWLARIVDTRDALRRVWDAQVEHREPSQADLDTVNVVLREAPRIELVPGDGCCGLGHRHTADDPAGEALARLVEPFVAAVAAGTTDRFRVCANDECRWVFEDTSRGGRRRWCDMTSCGNVAKVRRYRAKQREAAGEAVPTEPLTAPTEAETAPTDP
jgi:predicted RNA-binding Zn ribbon-like protein